MKQAAKRDGHSEIVEQRARARAQPTARPSSARCIRLTWLSWSARCARMRT